MADGPSAPAFDEVAAAIKAHPDWLTRLFDHHPRLLDTIAPGERHGDGVVDLQNRLIQRYRDEIAMLKGCTDDLIQTSRSNATSQQRVFDAALALIEAPDLDALTRTMTEDLPMILEIDCVRIGFEPAGPEFASLYGADIMILRPGFVDELLGAGTVRLEADADPHADLFGPDTPSIRSTALARMLPQGAELPPGIFALGARDPQLFHPSQATDLLAFLARVAQRCVRRATRAALP